MVSNGKATEGLVQHQFYFLQFTSSRGSMAIKDKSRNWFFFIALANFIFYY